MYILRDIIFYFWMLILLMSCSTKEEPIFLSCALTDYSLSEEYSAHLELYRNTGRAVMIFDPTNSQLEGKLTTQDKSYIIDFSGNSNITIDRYSGSINYNTGYGFTSDVV